MIRIRGLREESRGATALRGIDLDLEAGQALALFGTSGSGRTTLLEILATLRRPTAGEILLDGADLFARPLAARRGIGYLPASPAFAGQLTVAEHLEFAAAARGLDAERRRRAVAASLRLAELAGTRRIGELSAGLRRQLALAALLPVEPTLILLDEFPDGLDPLARRRFAPALRERCAGGAILVAACNALGGVEDLFGRAAFLHRGRLLAERTLDRSSDPAQTLAELVRGDGTADDPGRRQARRLR